MKKKNLKECPLGKQFEKVSHWANLKHIIPFQKIQFLNQRVFFWIFDKKIKAALTVEAAFIVPMFMLAMCMLLSILDCYRIQSIVKTSIHQSAMELGMYAYVKEGDSENIDVLNSALCTAYAQNNLPEFEDNVSVSVMGFYYRDHTILLRSTIKYAIPISLFPVTDLKFVNVSRVYGWTGNQTSGNSGETRRNEYKMVYVAQNESVYHTSASCSHIDIEIYQIKKNKIDQKYDACEKCCKDQNVEVDQTVYYTKTGDRYHIKKNCGSLKRMIRLVEYSQVNHLPICERCEKRE